MMRAAYLLLTVLTVTGLTACQQEETSTTTVVAPEATTPSQQATPPEAAGQAEMKVTATAESAPEAAEEIVEEAAKEVAKVVVAPAAPTAEVVPEPVAISPPVAEKHAVMAKAAEEARPTAVVEKVSGDPLQGAKVARKCSACHTFDQGGKNRTGPNLFGVFGRVKGAVAGFRYGSYLKAENAAGVVWNEASLRAWIANSKAVAKTAGGSSKMPTQKITGTKADNLMAYLKSLK